MKSVIIEITETDIMKAERLSKLAESKPKRSMRWQYHGSHFTLDGKKISLTDTMKLVDWILSHINQGIRSGHLHLDNQKRNRQAGTKSRNTKADSKNTNRTNLRTRQRKADGG